MERLRLAIIESYNELINKVTWPSWGNLQGSTIAVVIASMLLALVVTGMDFISKGVLTFLYNLNA
ncbi:MAG: preprotein translocase subunit SecE [Saprospiraceae bacterium]|nr:preprotein translocase subunit SecE [Saprospiraceae bacterium]